MLLCKSKTFPWPWFFLQNVSYLYLLMSVYFGCPYTAHTNFSISVSNWLLHSCSWPSMVSVEIYSAFFSTSLRGDIFPLRTKALVVSQPVRQWNAGNIEQMASPFWWTMSLTVSSLSLFPNPVSNSIDLLIWLQYFVSKLKTSMSGDLPILWYYQVLCLSRAYSEVRFVCLPLLVTRKGHLLKTHLRYFHHD